MQKYTKAQIDQMINEEFQKIMKQKALKTRLAQINEELSAMDSEDALLNEVEAAGEEKVSSHAWTGEANGDVKYKPKFEKIGTHLKEEEGEEGGESPMGEFEAKFAEIGRAIDAKMAAEMGGSSSVPAMDNDGDADDAGDEDFEEVDVEDGDDNEGSEEIEEGGYKETHQDENGRIVTADDMRESVEEPLEGESVAQMTDADTVNDNMEKDTHVNESKKEKGSIISEGASTSSKNIFTEGVDAAKKAKLMEEMNKMRKFAGLSRDEE